MHAGMAVLAGATVGGGTRINWNASFRTPDHVRKEWAEQHGLAAFASAQYDAALDAVCARLGVKAGKPLPSPNLPSLLHGLRCSASAPAACALLAHCT